MTTERLDTCFAKLKAEGRAAFVAYVMADDPDPETAFRIVSGLPAAGADIIQLGMPFSDPRAGAPADPARRPALAETGHHRGQDARRGPPLPPGRPDDPDRAHGLPQ